jgi:hypothetical protein
LLHLQQRLNRERKQKKGLLIVTPKGE